MWNRENFQCQKLKMHTEKNSYHVMISKLGHIFLKEWAPHSECVWNMSCLTTFLLNNLILAYNVLYITIMLYNFRVGHSVEMCKN
jgi:hypothetical protein